MKEASILIVTAAAVLTFSGCETTGSNYNRNNGYNSGSSYGDRGIPRVTALSNDRYSVSMGDGKVATINKYGGIISQANMTPAEQREAGAAVRTYRREQEGSDNHGDRSIPRVTALSNDRYSVSMGGGKIATLDKYGSIISQANMTRAEQREAGAAVRTYRREQQGSH